MSRAALVVQKGMCGMKYSIRRFQVLIMTAFLLLLMSVSCDDSGGGSMNALCGNGVAESGEECDATDLGTVYSCRDLGYMRGTLSCTAQCTYDMSGCIPVPETCGNGKVDAGEECDGSDLDGYTCESRGFPGGRLRCDDYCTFDESGCDGVIPTCGNGKVDPDTVEQCDRNDLNGMTCTALGFSGGDLSCTSNCHIDVSGCEGMSSMDQDKDGIPDPVDNCPEVPNPDQFDSDSDGRGDACENTEGTNSGNNVNNGTDEDYDGDGISGREDNCPYTPDPFLTDSNGDGIGDICQYTSVVTGNGFTCALTLDEGRVVCWGLNDRGQLGDGNTDDSVYPVVVKDINGNDLRYIVSLSAGDSHVCATDRYSKVYCWGDNTYGQLGSGLGVSYRAYGAPVHATSGTSGNLTGVIAMSAGAMHTCAVLGRDGSIVCWGYNSSGQIGDPDVGIGEISAIPHAVTDKNGMRLNGMTTVAAGYDHSCAVALDSDDSVLFMACWGSNDSGQCGYPSTVTASGNMDATDIFPAAVQVDSTGWSTGIQTISAGDGFTCAVSSGDGHAWCWGDNTHGTLANPAVTDATSFPVMVLTDATSVSTEFTSSLDAAYSHVCAVATSGSIMCWGLNTAGELGFTPTGQAGDIVHTASPLRAQDGSLFSVPEDTSGQSAPTAHLSMGYDHACIIMPSSTDAGSEIWCWGSNEHGQLGTGDTSDSVYPRPVAESAYRLY